MTQSDNDAKAAGKPTASPDSEKPSEGDILKFPRTFFYFFSFNHYAIFVGKDDVIHKTGAPNLNVWSFKDKGFIEKMNLETVAMGKPFLIGNGGRHEPSLLPLPTILERANSKFGQSGYNLFSNNCEHFVMWCRYDKLTSLEVEDKCTVAVFIGSICLLSSTTIVMPLVTKFYPSRLTDLGREVGFFLGFFCGISIIYCASVS